MVRSSEKEMNKEGKGSNSGENDEDNCARKRLMDL